LKELRPDPEKTRIRPHLHPAFSAGEKKTNQNLSGYTRLAMKHSKLDIESGLFFPRSGIEDSREFQSSQIPGKVFCLLPMLSSMPPASPKGKAGVRQSFGLFRFSCVCYGINARWLPVFTRIPTLPGALPSCRCSGPLRGRRLPLSPPRVLPVCRIFPRGVPGRDRSCRGREGGWSLNAR